MFNKKNNNEKCVSAEKTALLNQLNQLRVNHQLEILEIRKDNELALKEKDFQLKHYESETVKALTDKVNALEQQKAVLQKEKEMLDKITDLNADVIDVKELVKNLINKLPEIKISSLAVTNNESSK